MTERPPSRAALEAHLREILPSAPLTLGDADPRSNAAVAGATGVVVGFLWGWLRGRRRRR